MSVEAFGLRVQGIPITQGSKTKNRYGAIYDDNAKTLKPWRKSVTDTAKAQAGPDWQPLVGPLRATLLFAFPRPKSHPKKARTWPTHKKDIDKLTRAVFDSLSAAGIWLDDGQVIELRTLKDWCGPAVEQMSPGVLIAIYKVEHAGPRLPENPTLEGLLIP